LESWLQFTSSGEQNCPSGVHGSPLVTLCPLPAHVQRTVSPTEMLTVSGEKLKPGPTCTSTICPAGERTPLGTGRPFWSTMRISWPEETPFDRVASFCSGLACARKVTANSVPTQKVSRTSL
jgi:hypothetical protein